jgi:hypothetical protein
MKKVLMILAWILMVSSQCSEKFETDIPGQEAVFAKIYENHAWGHSFEGWIIDKSGNVRGFSLSRNPDLQWNRFSDSRYISVEKMEENMIQTDTVYLNIDRNSLVKYYLLIPEAARAILTEASTSGADMGQVSYYALEFFPEDRQYRWILLESYGDYVIENTSPEAEQIAAWLKKTDSLSSAGN